MKKAVKWITAIVILSAAVLLVVLKLVDESNKVEFADENLASRIICTGLSKKILEESPKRELSFEDFRKDDLKYVTSLRIVNIIGHETLVDLGKCWNLRRLEIKDGYGECVMRYGEDWAVQEYKAVYGELPSLLNAEKIKQFEAELEGVLQECKQLEDLFIYNWGDSFNLDSLQFLIYGENLTELGLYYLGDIDYSPVLECTNLKVLSLSDCAISELGQISRLEKLRELWLSYTGIKEAGDIVNLKNLETLYITGTPLAENEEELQRLREALPNLEIITDGSY